MFVNFGYVGGESVNRGLSGNIGKRTQENASPSGFFPGYICGGIVGNHVWVTVVACACMLSCTPHKVIA